MISHYSLSLTLTLALTLMSKKYLVKCHCLSSCPVSSVATYGTAVAKKRKDMRPPTPNMVSYKSLKLKVAATHLGCIPSIILIGKYAR